MRPALWRDGDGVVGRVRTFRPEADGYGRFLRDDIVERAGNLQELTQPRGHGRVDAVTCQAAAILLPEGVCGVWGRQAEEKKKKNKTHKIIKN